MRTVLSVLFALMAVSLGFFVWGCAPHANVVAGMSGQDLTALEGQPTTKWSGSNGVECWKYDAVDTWYVIFQDGKILKIVDPGNRRNEFNGLAVGMPEAAALDMLGEPVRTSEIKNVKYLSYIFRVGRARRLHTVRIVNGFVEAYGDDRMIRKLE